MMLYNLVLLLMLLPKKAQSPSTLAVIIFTIAGIGVLFTIAVMMFDLRSEIFFWFCGISADYRDLALKEFIGSGNFAKEMFGEALASLPMICGVKTNIESGGTQDFKKVDKEDFLTALQKESQRCWTIFNAGEGDFAHNLRNPFICELLSYDLKESVSMNEIKDKLSIPLQLRSANEEYYTSIYEDYRSAPGVYDASFSGPVSVFVDYFDYGSYGKGDVSKCKVYSFGQVKCDAVSTVECGKLYGAPTGEGVDIGSGDYTQFGSSANFCTSRSSSAPGLTKENPLLPASCSDALLLCFRFEGDVVIPATDYMCLDVISYRSGDSGISNECPVEKVISTTISPSSFDICTGGDSCEDGVLSTSLEISIDEKVKQIEFSWFTSKDVKITASYFDGTNWKKFHELKALRREIEKDKEHYSKTQINDYVEKIKFECDGNQKEEYVCKLYGLLNITYVTTT